MISLLVLTIKAPVPNYPKNIFTRYQDTYLKLFEPKSRYAVNIRDKKTILALKFEKPDQADLLGQDLLYCPNLRKVLVT